MKAHATAFRRLMEIHGIADADVAQFGGRYLGGFCEIDDRAYKRLRFEHRAKRGAVVLNASPANPLPEPTLAELAGNFATAVGRWLAAGAPVVSAEQYAARAAVCAVCEYWDGAARLGLGTCKAPGCGCTSFKRWLATERCPLSKWAK